MSAEILSRAASLMRERAEAAPSGSWGVDEIGAVWVDHDPEGHSASCLVDRFPIWGDGAGEHIASWQPDVALAVADLLELDADCHIPDDYDEASDLGRRYLLRIARAYLGESA